MSTDAAAPSVIDATDLVAGYVPEVNILNGCNVAGRAWGVRRDHRSQRRRRIDIPQGRARSQFTVRSGVVRLHGDDITGQPAHKLVQRGVGFVPGRKNVFQTLTVRENLEMGCFLAPRRFNERYEVVVGLFPRFADALNGTPDRCRGANARWWPWGGR